MKNETRGETTGHSVAPSFDTTGARERDDLPAWEPIGDGRWLPQRVRGSNRGRALG